MDPTSTTSVLSGIVTEDMISGVMDEVVGLLPIVIPAAITFLGIRKGIGFLLGALARA